MAPRQRTNDGNNKGYGKGFYGGDKGGYKGGYKGGWQQKGGGKGNKGYGKFGKGNSWNGGGGKGMYELDAFGMWLDDAAGNHWPNEALSLEVETSPKTFQHPNKFEILSNKDEFPEFENIDDEKPKKEKFEPIKAKSQKEIKQERKQLGNMKEKQQDETERKIDELLDQLDREYDEDDNEEVTEQDVEELKEMEMNLFDVDSDDDDIDGINEFGNAHEKYNEWVKVSSVVDSGAADNVTNRQTAPKVPVRPSEGSRRGQKYVAANGEKIMNEGEQELQVVTEEGAKANVKYQITDVKRPLMSVGKLCDRGNRVIFGRGGGVIHNVRTGTVTSFKRSGGIYTVDLWVRQNDGTASGFPGQS